MKLISCEIRVFMCDKHLLHIKIVVFMCDKNLSYNLSHINFLVAHNHSTPQLCKMYQIPFRGYNLSYMCSFLAYNILFRNLP